MWHHCNATHTFVARSAGLFITIFVSLATDTYWWNPPKEHISLPLSRISNSICLGYILGKSVPMPSEGNRKKNNISASSNPHKVKNEWNLPNKSSPEGDIKNYSSSGIMMYFNLIHFRKHTLVGMILSQGRQGDSHFVVYMMDADGLETDGLETTGATATAGMLLT